MVKSFLSKVATIWGTALILLFFSEFYFLNEHPVEMIIAGLSQPFELVLFLLEFSIYYALFATIFLFVLEYFHVKTILNVFLAGALFGWATEALIVPVVYEAVPISIIFPSISWHALIDVLVGWYLIRRLMRLNNVLFSTMLFVGIGIIWAFWATWFWSDTTPNSFMPILPNMFTGFAFATSSIWILGMIFLDYFGGVRLVFSKWEIGCVGAITFVLFVMTAMLYLPFSLVLLPFIAVTIFALYRSKSTNDTVNRLQFFSESPPKLWYYLLAFLTPIIASVTYLVIYENDIAIPSEDVTFLLFTLGLLIYLVALVRPFFKK